MVSSQQNGIEEFALPDYYQTCSVFSQQMMLQCGLPLELQAAVGALVYFGDAVDAAAQRFHVEGVLLLRAPYDQRIGLGSLAIDVLGRFVWTAIRLNGEEQTKKWQFLILSTTIAKKANSRSAHLARMARDDRSPNTSSDVSTNTKQIKHARQFQFSKNVTNARKHNQTNDDCGIYNRTGFM